MAKRARAFLTAVALVVAAESVARAQHVPEAISTDRPTVAASSRTVGAGVLQGELGTDLAAPRQGDGLTFSTPMKFRLGIVDPLEFHVEAPLLLVVGDGQSTNAGVGNIDVGFKWNLFPGKTWIPSSALFFAVETPTGDPNVTDAPPALKPIALLEWPLFAGIGLTTNVGAYLPTERRALTADELRFAGAFSRSVVGPLTLFFEFFGTHRFDGSDPATDVGFDTGLLYAVNDHVQLDALFRVGFVAETMDFGGGLGLSFRVGASGSGPGTSDLPKDPPEPPALSLRSAPGRVGPAGRT